MHNYIFNRKVLNNRLKNFTKYDIENYDNKYKRMCNWAYILEQKGLDKTREEELQGIFIYQVFTEVLGYKDRINHKIWNVQQENKTEMDATKADGGLGFFSSDFEDVRAIIELKDARTNLDAKQKRTSGDTPVSQAFMYSSKIKSVRWVIVSNFKEIRLYNSLTQTEYESFSVLEMRKNEEEFLRFVYLMRSEFLLKRDGKSDLDLLYETNEKEEKKITTDFYNLYRKTRINFYEHLVKYNPEIDELTLFSKTQLILDRCLFIFFCEDSHLLKEHTFANLIEKAKGSYAVSDEKIWPELMGLFNSIDKGNPYHEINRFNGGLFKQDDVLENLTIKDEFLESFSKMAEFDFESELSATILGYIFEQSISDIEEFKKELRGEIQDKTQTKRKKDGIFYTSPGIVKYLLEESLFKWIEDKEKELKIDKFVELTDDFMEKALAKGNTSEKKALKKQIKAYEDLLLKVRDITILDPAVGSGAFLNGAFSLLLQKGEIINEEVVKRADRFAMFDIQKNILQNNLFGVDLNSESVELARLALWLRTANKRDPLTSLDNNIQTGNSLIEDSAVSDLSFNWMERFPRNQDGFDVIVGNPPYVFARNQGFTEKEKLYFGKEENYRLAKYQLNTYLLFIERAYKLLKPNGWFAFIVPNTCLTIDSYSKLREFLLTMVGELKIVNIYDKLFADANVDCCFIIFKKTSPTTVTLGEYRDEVILTVAEVKPEELLNTKGSIINIALMKNKSTQDLVEKINQKGIQLIEAADVKSGLKAYEVGKGTPPQTKEQKDNRVYHSKNKETDNHIMYLEGKDVCRYYIEWGGQYLQYGTNLAGPRKSEMFINERILVRQIPTKGKYAINAVYTDKHLLNDINSMVIFDFNKDPYFLLGALNSKIITFWFINYFDKFQRKLFPQFKVKELKLFPMPPKYEKEISLKTKELVKAYREVARVIATVNRLIESQIGVLDKSIDKNKWSELTDTTFIKLIESKKKINMNEKSDWLDFFTKQRANSLSYEKSIEKLNLELDELIGKSFDLTENELKFIDEQLEEFLAL